MGAAGAHICNFSVLHADHAAPCYPQSADIQGRKIRLVTAYFPVPDHNPSVLYHRNVRGSTAGFQKYPIGKPLVHQHAGHPRRQSGQHGKNRTAPHFLHCHDAAVAAHDHQRRGNTRPFHTGFRHVRRFHHLRYQAAINDCGTGTYPQAVKL